MFNNFQIYNYFLFGLLTFHFFLICCPENYPIYSYLQRSNPRSYQLDHFIFMATPAAYGNSWAGVESEWHLRPMPQPQQHRTRAASATYTTACGNAGSLTD